MPLSPEDILNAKFSITLRRGYDRDEVDAFLSDLAGDYQEALRAPRASGDPFAQLGDKVAQVVRVAHEAAQSMRRDAEREAADIRRRAADKAREVAARAEQEAAATLAQAREQAERIRREADTYSATVRAKAERERAAVLDDATRRHEAMEAHEHDLRARLVAAEEALGVLRDSLRIQASGGEARVHGVSPRADDAAPEADPPEAASLS